MQVSNNPILRLLISLILLLTFIPITQIFAQDVATTQISFQDMNIIPGDKLRITYYELNPQGNLTEKSVIEEVKPDGTITIQIAGQPTTINLKDLSIRRAEEEIINKLKEYFKNPKVSIEIIEKTKIKIFLWGAVSKPGVFAIPPTTTIAEFIMQYAALIPEADISKITIAREDGSIVNFDLNDFLFTNNTKNNIFLKNNDKVVVPRIYPYKETHPLSRSYILQPGNVIKITISEISSMTLSNITPEICTIDPSGKIFHKKLGSIKVAGLSLDKAEEALTEVAKRHYRDPIVKIEVIQIASANVYVFGEVNRPGIYPLEGNTRVAEFLAQIGGLTSQADLDNIIITRANNKTVTFSLNDYLFKRHDKNNIYLADGDRIIVLSKKRGLIYRLADKFHPFYTIITTLTATVVFVSILINKPLW